MNQAQGTVIAILNTNSDDQITAEVNFWQKLARLSLHKIDLSYAFERIHVETLTKLQLSGCWLSATFDARKASEIAKVQGGEVCFVDKNLC